MQIKIEKLKSGSMRCGPNLYARKCEGGYELWQGLTFGYTREWRIQEVVDKETAMAWMRTWKSDEQAR